MKYLKRLLAFILALLMAFPVSLAEETAQQDEFAVPIVSRDAFCQAFEECTGLPIVWGEPRQLDDLMVESCSSLGDSLSMIRRDDRVVGVMSISGLDMEDLMGSLQDCLASTLLILITLNRATGMPLDQAQQEVTDWIETSEFIYLLTGVLSGEECSVFTSDYNWFVEVTLEGVGETYALVVSVKAVG